MKLNLKDIIGHPLFLVVIGGFITVAIGTWLTAFWAQQNFIRQVKLEIYKDRMHQQSKFVDNLSKDVYSRLYNLKVYFWNLTDGAKKETIVDSWNMYKNETIKWNETLKYNFINLDRYFPPNEFRIGDFVRENDLLRNYADKSFRKTFEEIIQRQFVVTHRKLIDTRIKVSNNEKISEDQLSTIEGEIEILNSLAYEFPEALLKASSDYKILSGGKLLE